MAGFKLAVALLWAAAAGAWGLTVTELKRNIDLAGGYARHTVEVTVDDKSPSHFYFAFPAANASNIARVAVQKKGKTSDLLLVTPDKVPSDLKAPEGSVLYRMKLKKESFTLIVLEGRSIVPSPAEVSSQSAPNLVEYWGQKKLYSPYTVSKQTTTVQLPKNTKVEDDAGGKREGADKINFDVSSSASAWSSSGFRVHFTTTSKIIGATRVTRVMQLSHWGVMNAEEDYAIVNRGHKFTGSFSRLDYEHSKPAAAFEDLQANINKEAFDIYFRDTIGNISTSRVHKHGKNKIQVTLQQRYPVVGGWGSKFYWGFFLPMENCVTQEDDGSFKYTVQFAPFIKQVMADDLEVEVRLPDGASVISVKSEGKKEDREGVEIRNTKTNLYVFGRPTVVLRANNVINPDHGEMVVINYNLATTTMLTQPLFLASIFAGFFSLSFFYMGA